MANSATFVAIEVVGTYVSKSLVLTSERTFVQPRAEILAAPVNAVTLIEKADSILREAVPRGIVGADARRAIDVTPGVEGVRDLHVWTVASGLTALSALFATSDTAQWETWMTPIARV